MGTVLCFEAEVKLTTYNVYFACKTYTTEFASAWRSDKLPMQSGRERVKGMHGSKSIMIPSSDGNTLVPTSEKKIP